MLDYAKVAIASQVISAVLFLAVIVYLWNRLVLPAVVAAQAAKNRQIAEAERHRDDAKAVLDVLQTEIQGAGRDAVAIRRRAHEQGEHEKAALVAESTDAGERALRSAQGELQRARANARTRLRSRLIEKALDVAKNDAGRRIDESANAKLVAGFVTSLKRENADG